MRKRQRDAATKRLGGQVDMATTVFGVPAVPQWNVSKVVRCYVYGTLIYNPVRKEDENRTFSKLKRDRATRTNCP